MNLESIIQTVLLRMITIKKMTTRNTKQKTVIKEYLSGTNIHPTAEMVYNAIRPELPKISLGTVYRVLNNMATSGDILKIRLDDGLDHFDALTRDHYHFICRNCGAVSDIFEVEDNIRVDTNKFRGKLMGHSTFFYGQCEACSTR